MKKLTIIAGIALGILATGCNKIKNLANINFDVPYTTQVSVPDIPGYTQGIALPAGGVEASFPAVPFATNSAQYLSQYGSATNLVEDVDLKSLALQILPPSTQNFDFLDNVDVYISSKDLPEVLVASEASIAKGQSTLNLTTNSGANLKAYYTQDTVYIRLQAHFNAVPVAGEQLNIASVFHVLANPLN